MRVPLHVLVDERARAGGLAEGPRGIVGDESAYVLQEVPTALVYPTPGTPQPITVAADGTLSLAITCPAEFEGRLTELVAELPSGPKQLQPIRCPAERGARLSVSLSGLPPGRPLELTMIARTAPPTRAESSRFGIPTGAELRVRLGVDSLRSGEAPPARFVVRARARAGRSATLLARTLDPAHNRSEATWIDERVALDGVRDSLGPDLQLVFKAKSARTAGRLGFPLWGDPVIVGPPGDASAPAPRNVVLVSLDTLRADGLGCYGGPSTPTLDRIAHEGALFEVAVAAAPSTRPSHASMLTGVYPCVHGVGADGGVGLPAALSPLAEILRQKGYTTAAITEGGDLDAATFARGFGSFRVNSAGTLDRPTGRVEDDVADARAWLARHADERFFLFLHTYQTHAPYTPPAPYRTVDAEKRSREPDHDLYEAEVRYTDDALAPLFAALDGLGLDERTIVVVTSDHGEAFGEHGSFFHGDHLYEEDVRIPLIWWAPGLIPSGRRISAVAGLADIVPSVLRVVGIEPPAWVHGRDLTRALLQDPPVVWGENMVYSENLRSPGASHAVAVQGAGWKSFFSYPYPPHGEMTFVHLAKDPGERNPMDISYDSVSWTVYLAKECRRATELLGGRTVSRPAEPLLDFQLRGRLAGETT